LEDFPMRKTRLWTLMAALALVIGSVALAACGDDDSGGSSGGQPATDTNPDVAKLVPQEIKSQGTLTMATDASYPPVEFFDTDGKSIIGFDIDLAEAMAAEMGLELEVQNATFDSILTGIAADKYDFSMSAFTDTKEREQTVDFVTYFTAGTSFYSAADADLDVQSLDDLCGHTVAVEKGTVQATDSEAQDGKCKAAGKGGVEVSVFPDQNGANLAISSGRAEIGMADSPVAAYIVDKSGGQFVLGGEFASEPYGIALPKGSGLEKAFKAALEDLIANGTYEDILKDWNVESGGIQKPEINGAIS
jgi:polar amino acid transport system substrate-binding protein